MEVNTKVWLKYLGWVFLAALLFVLIFDFLKKGIFVQKLGINLLVVGDQNVGVFVLRPNENIYTWITLPTSLKVKIYNSTATYPISSLWKFGVSEKNPYQIIEKSLSSAIGAPMPRMIKVDGEASIENVLGKILSISLKTDLSIRDRWLIRSKISEAAISKKIVEQEIPKIAFDKVVEADGKEFLILNQVVDVWGKDKFYYEDILSEGAEVAINNISGVAGAGNILSKQLEASGLRVVDVSNNMEDSISQNGCHFASFDKFPETSSFLKNHLGCIQIAFKAQDKDAGKVVKVWIK